MPVCGIPYEPTSTQILGGPLIWWPQPMVKNIEGYHMFALGAQNPDKTSRMSTNLASLYALFWSRSNRWI